MAKRILYISYDGMTDPLGQSQVIPYLKGLAGKGYEIIIISAEKPGIFEKNQEQISGLLKSYNIQWEPVSYTKKPPVLSTIVDVRKLKKKALRLHRENPFQWIHCRSYISAFVGVFMKQKFGCKFLFDMRGFWADERVDGKIWNLKNPVFKTVYKFFKRKEKQFMNYADAIVSLTEAGKHEILKWNLKGVSDSKISVIPCCADFNHFDYNKFKNSEIVNWRKKLDISEDSYVLSYLGSIGTWYMLEEMLQFFKQLKKEKPDSIFLFITPDHPAGILRKGKEFGINLGDIRTRSASRNEVPEMVQVSDTSIFFIKPVWSKKASSPTKMAELMGLGIPIVANSNVGDVDLVMKQNPTGILVNGFNETDFDMAIKKLLTISDKKKAKVRDLACNYFSLEKGISTFDEIYKKTIE